MHSCFPDVLLVALDLAISCQFFCTWRVLISDLALNELFEPASFALVIFDLLTWIFCLKVLDSGLS